MQIVYNDGCKWRYKLNAKKRGIMVFGEGAVENTKNSTDQIFELGHNRVNERKGYDHAGVRAT